MKTTRPRSAARAVAAGPRVDPRPRTRRRQFVPLFMAGLLIAAVAAWFVLRGRGTAGLDSRRHLNVVMITLDTTRADRIGAYGDAHAATPNIDRLAAEGVLFEQATTSAPLTLPAHSTMFTGRFPPVHGVRDNGGFFLDPSQVTLAETLKTRGYATAAFVAAYVLDSKWGLDQGFDTYVDDFDLTKYRAISLAAIQRRGDEVVNEGLKWLAANTGAPFFAWMHLYDPHTPYDPPEPYRTQFAGRPYAGEIAFTDSQVGRVLDFLRERDLLDRTIVVVVGDHGESLDEHGEASHGFFIYQSVLRVPLIIRSPVDARRGRRVPDPVRTVDIFPTLASLLGIAAPPSVEGSSLVPLMTGASRELALEAYAESLYPLHHYGWSDLRSLRSGRYKLIAAPRPELFDLDQDPGEKTNLFDDRRPLADRMLARLREIEGQFAAHERPQQGPVEVDPDARARLAALGYVGSFTSSVKPDENRTGLADPKDKIGLFNLISEARDITKDENRFDDVVAILKRVLREDPAVIDAWFMLGNVHAKANKQEQAIEYFKKVLALKPDDEMAVVNMANAYRQIGRDEEALVGYRRFLQLDKRNAQVRYEVAQILIDRGELGEARKMLTEALEIEPKLNAARNALGVVALNSGDLTSAEREIRALLTRAPDVRLAHYNLALVAERRGDWQTAEAEYRRELELHAANYKAAFNLARLYEQLGNRRGQEEWLKKAIEINPKFAEGHFYLAKLYLDEGRNFAEAVAIAQRGIELRAQPDMAPLGHYVLADLYNRLGRQAEARRQAQLGRELEARSRALGAENRRTAAARRSGA